MEAMVTNPSMDVQLIVDKNRRRFLQVLGLLGAIFPVFWVIFMLLSGKTPTYLFDGAIFLVSLFVCVYFTLAKKVKAGFWITTILMSGLLFYMNFLEPSGTQKQEFGWISLFPLVSMFLLGKKNGILLTFFYFLAGAIFISLWNVFPDDPLTVIFKVADSIAATVLILYFYQESQEKTQQMVQERGKALEIAVRTLEKEVTRREEVQKELEVTLQKVEEEKKELDRVNKLMIGRELAMAEMKMKIQTLENQLSVQK